MRKIDFALVYVSLAMAGCQTADHTDRGALFGSGLGAATGAIIGHHNGDTAGGAVLGAAAGALTGSLIGNAQDAREEQNAAIAQAHQAELQAMTNDDLIKLTRAGISPELIVSTVRDRGGRFDLSPDQIIALKQNGVSDQVLQAVQGMRSASAKRIVPQAYNSSAVVMSPDVIVVPPRIGVGVVVGPRPVPYHHRGYYGPRRHYPPGHFRGAFWW